MLLGFSKKKCGFTVKGKGKFCLISPRNGGWDKLDKHQEKDVRMSHFCKGIPSGYVNMAIENGDL